MKVTPPTVVLPLSVANGGTGVTSYTIGDLLYASAAGVLSRLAAVALGAVLVSAGVGIAPTWSATPTLTSVTAPTIIGGTAVGSSLTLQSTSAVGTTDFIRFLVGNNGATEAARFTNAGTLAMGASAISFGGDSTFVTDGANVVKLVNGTNAQELRVYRNATSYLRLIAGANPTIDGNYGTLSFGGTLNVQIAAGAEFITNTGIVMNGVAGLRVEINANLRPVSVSGYSMTGSSALSLMSLAGTLNTSGAPTVLDVNITQTASGAATLLLQIRDGATNYLKLTKAGALDVVSYLVGGAAGVSGTFTTVDGKTVTTTLGLVTGIV